jgi:Spy/CpxP family protein refolding chaperone
MTTITRARLIAAALIVLVAAVGFAAGVITERVVFATPAAAPAAEDAPATDGFRMIMRGERPMARGEGPRFRFMLPGRLASELDLSAEQQAAIEQILAEDQAAIRALTDELRPALIAVVEGSRQRIHDVLTDEQKARWQALPPRRMHRGGGPSPN